MPCRRSVSAAAARGRNGPAQLEGISTNAYLRSVSGVARLYSPKYFGAGGLGKVLIRNGNANLA